MEFYKLEFQMVLEFMKLEFLISFATVALLRWKLLCLFNFYGTRPYLARLPCKFFFVFFGLLTNKHKHKMVCLFYLRGTRAWCA